MKITLSTIVYIYTYQYFRNGHSFKKYLICFNTSLKICTKFQCTHDLVIPYKDCHSSLFLPKKTKKLQRLEVYSMTYAVKVYLWIARTCLDVQAVEYANRGHSSYFIGLHYIQKFDIKWNYVNKILWIN